MVNIQNNQRITDIHKKVPLMFQAQINGRCQLNYLVQNREPDSLRWVNEWTERASKQVPQFDEKVQSRSYIINWRFITNAGQDDGIIRPVIGARGIPFFPGSSMKGAFSRACSKEQRERYCGKNLGNGDFAPGILRFQGGYPADNSWTNKMLDVVHPQQTWQVQSLRHGGAFPMISLYKPTMNFGISSTIDLAEDEWNTIWEIWEKAFSRGIGCRVSAGYGQSAKTNKATFLYTADIKGEGIASKLLDGSAEFRPNIFRATIRGHALRIFGGLTDANSAERAVERLFGGTQNDGGTYGLLTMRFRENELDLGTFGTGNWQAPTYEVEGRLGWLLNQELPEAKVKELTELINFLNIFAMILGGFGRSWRRSHHDLFYPEYYNNGRTPLIGCHWQWQKKALVSKVKVRLVDQLTTFIDNGLENAKTWLRGQNFPVNPNNYAQNWRESWHPQKVQVWGRLADDSEDSLAIRWLHGPYQRANRDLGTEEGMIYHTNLTGRMGQVGRVWHRMYPQVILRRNDDGTPNPIVTRNYLEFLTIFPDESQESTNFLRFLARANRFQKVWPIN